MIDFFLNCNKQSLFFYVYNIFFISYQLIVRLTSLYICYTNHLIVGYQDDIQGDNSEDISRWYPDDNVSYNLLLESGLKK